MPAGGWAIHILDDSDQAGALGHHDTDPADTPRAFVFARTDRQYALDSNVTLTHELFEILADPRISRGEQVTDSQWYALEVGDPVEADTYAYTRMSASGRPIRISDFITERWFDPNLTTGPFDYAGHLSRPLQVLHGGYVSIYENGGWTQSQAQADGTLKPVPLDHTDPRFRRRDCEARTAC